MFTKYNGRNRCRVPDSSRAFGGVESPRGLLEAFYKGAPGSGFVAQTLISQTLIQRDVPINSGSDEYADLYERSIFSAHHCFIPAMQAADQLTSIEANILVNKNQGWGWRKWGVKQKWSTDHSIFCLGFFI